MVGIFYEVIDEEKRITQVTDRPEPFVGKENFIIVDNFPISEIHDGYYALPYINIETKEIYYKYIEIQKQPSPPTTEQRIAELESVVNLIILGGL